MKPEELPVIESKRLRLRPITDADTDTVVRWRNNPAVLRNFIYRGPFTAEVHRKWLETKVAAGKVIQYIIVERESGRSIGSVYLRDIDENSESAEYGVFLGEDWARGLGYGSETAKAFTSFAFDTLGLHRVSLRVLAGNEAARRSYQRAGYRTEGIFRDYVKLDGVYTDVVFMAKLSEKKGGETR